MVKRILGRSSPEVTLQTPTIVCISGNVGLHQWSWSIICISGNVGLHQWNWLWIQYRRLLLTFLDWRLVGLWRVLLTFLDWRLGWLVRLLLTFLDWRLGRLWRLLLTCWDWRLGWLWRLLLTFLDKHNFCHGVGSTITTMAESSACFIVTGLLVNGE
jgi:hypothetical protein